MHTLDSWSHPHIVFYFGGFLCNKILMKMIIKPLRSLSDVTKRISKNCRFNLLSAGAHLRVSHSKQFTVLYNLLVVLPVGCLQFWKYKFRTVLINHLLIFLNLKFQSKSRKNMKVDSLLELSVKKKCFENINELVNCLRRDPLSLRWALRFMSSRCQLTLACLMN